MAKLMHENSAECLNSGLNIFTVPPTQTAFADTSILIATPDKLGDIIEINLKGSDHYLDLSRSFMKIQLQVTKKDCTTIGGDNVAVVSDIFDALFKQIDLYLGSKLITTSDNNHAYKSFIFHLLNSSRAAGKTYLKCIGWIPDTMKQQDAFTADNVGQRRLHGTKSLDR